MGMPENILNSLKAIPKKVNAWYKRLKNKIEPPIEGGFHIDENIGDTEFYLQTDKYGVPIL